MKKLKETILQDLYKELLYVGLIVLLQAVILFIGLKYNTLTLVLFGAMFFILTPPMIGRVRYIRYCLELLGALKLNNPEKFFKDHLIDQHVMFRNTEHNVVSENYTNAKIREIGLIEKLNKVMDQQHHIEYDEKDPFFEYYKNKTTS